MTEKLGSHEVDSILHVGRFRNKAAEVIRGEMERLSALYPAFDFELSCALGRSPTINGQTSANYQVSVTATLRE